MNSKWTCRLRPDSKSRRRSRFVRGCMDWMEPAKLRKPPETTIRARMVWAPGVRSPRVPTTLRRRRFGTRRACLRPCSRPCSGTPATPPESRTRLPDPPDRARARSRNRTAGRCRPDAPSCHRGRPSDRRRSDSAARGDRVAPASQVAPRSSERNNTPGSPPSQTSASADRPWRGRPTSPEAAVLRRPRLRDRLRRGGGRGPSSCPRVGGRPSGNTLTPEDVTA